MDGNPRDGMVDATGETGHSWEGLKSELLKVIETIRQVLRRRSASGGHEREALDGDAVQGPQAQWHEPRSNRLRGHCRAGHYRPESMGGAMPATKAGPEAEIRAEPGTSIESIA